MNPRLKGLFLFLLGVSYWVLTVLMFFVFRNDADGYTAAGIEGVYFFLTFFATIGFAMTYFGIGQTIYAHREFCGFRWLTKKVFVWALCTWLVLIVCALNWISFLYAQTISLFSLFYLLFLSFFLIFYRYVFSKKGNFKNEKSKRFHAISAFDQFYMCGVDVLDDANRVKLKGNTIRLLIPKSKDVLAETDEVYQIQGQNFKFQLAFYKAENGNRFIYFVGYRDFYKYARNDINFYLKDELIQNRGLLRKYWSSHLYVPLYDDTDTYYSNYNLYRCKVCAYDNLYVPELEKYGMDSYRFSKDGDIRYWMKFPIRDELATESHEEATKMALSWIDDINCYLDEEFDPSEEDYDMV